MIAELAILVVDDDAFVRSTITRQLSAIGVKNVTTAANGHEASAHVNEAQRKFDVIISDLQMPDEDGLQLMRRLSTDTHNPEVILISGLDQRLLRTAEEIAHQRGIRVLGSVMKPVSTKTLQTLLERAGSNSTPTPKSSADLRVVTPEELMTALASRQIHIAVQPKLALADNSVCGVEALARWTPAHAPPIPPSQFVELAEKNHLIGALTDSVVQQAFELASQWQKLGLNLKVSVNLAPMNLSELDLPDRLRRLAHDVGVPTSQMVLEVTESGITGVAANVLEVLGRLRLAGFGISIDDFGTGYSSLQRLNWVPFTELKIDRSFVIAAPTDPKARSIIQHSLTLAHDLGLTSVAEGIETEDELALLRDMGCEIIQGYLISKPMTPDRMPDWIRSRTGGQ